VVSRAVREETNRRRVLIALGLSLCAAPSCRRKRASETAVPVHAPNAMRATGLFWARVGDVPDGMRVRVWLDSDGERVRGAYSVPPYNGEIDGRVAQPDTVQLRAVEYGMTRAIATRTRNVTLRWAPDASLLSGVDDTGVRFELVRAGFVSPTLRPGLWISHWTGLPAGLAVETRITHGADGRWRAAYQYQGTGNVRDGSFEGTQGTNGALEIAWTEIAEGGNVSRGRGRLLPTMFGLQGTFGIEGSNEGTGEWTLEPLSP
jgi:hypothetical protein